MGLLILFSGSYIIVSKRDHLLSVLLSFEFIRIGIYFLFLSSLILIDLFYSLIYITFTACEGALGLAVLIRMSRTHGGDYFKSLNLIYDSCFIIFFFFKYSFFYWVGRNFYLLINFRLCCFNNSFVFFLHRFFFFTWVRTL